MHIPSPITSGEQIHDALARAHTYYRGQAASEADLPAWYLHLPSGERIRIRTIGVFEPFVRFEALDGHTTALVAPEAVALTIAPIPPDSGEPRGLPIGFAPLATPDKGADADR